MKKVVVIGTGAQGTTVAKRLDEEPSVGEIICADYNRDAVDELAGSLKKAAGQSFCGAGGKGGLPGFCCIDSFR